MKIRVHDNGGFTIAEVLVAILIFSVVTVPLTTLLHRMVSDNTARVRLCAAMTARSAMEETLQGTGSLKEEEERLLEETEGFKVYRTVAGKGLQEITIRVVRKEHSLFELKTLLAGDPNPPAPFPYK